MKNLCCGCEDPMNFLGASECKTAPALGHAGEVTGLGCFVVTTNRIGIRGSRLRPGPDRWSRYREEEAPASSFGQSLSSTHRNYCNSVIAICHAP